MSLVEEELLLNSLLLLKEHLFTDELIITLDELLKEELMLDFCDELLLINEELFEGLNDPPPLAEPV